MITMEAMETVRQMTVREVRKHSDQLAGDWTAVETGEIGRYTLRCGEVEVCTVNARKPRIFRSLDAVKQALKEEMGITEFKVEAVKM